MHSDFKSIRIQRRIPTTSTLSAQHPVLYTLPTSRSIAQYQYRLPSEQARNLLGYRYGT